MSIKLKALSLGLMALLATAGFAVVNASATVSGHFTHDNVTNNATIIGTENGTHDLEFREEGSSPEDPGITCTHAHYHGEVTAKTVQTVTVKPTYTQCQTTKAATHNVTVHTNGCGFTLHSRTPPGDATVEVECPTGKSIVITHPNCEITVPAQKPSATHLTGGLFYHTTQEGNPLKHTLTATVTVKKITGQFHGGLCVFLGTSHLFEMNGSLTVEGKDPVSGNRVNITHT